MKLFNVPADFRTSTIDRFAELNSRRDDAAVSETYGSITRGAIFGSGRAVPDLPDLDFKGLERYVDYSVSRGIEFNYTLNPSCVGNMEMTSEGLKQIETFLSQLWDIGIKGLTVTMPTLMTIIKQSGHPFSIKASTICQINSAFKAEYYRNFGVDRIVIDEDITRDFRRIRQICEVFGDGVEMIVNSACIRDCPNKMFHYNNGSHYGPDQEVTGYFEYYCTAASAIVDPAKIMRLNWVRPEDLQLYEKAGIHRFKIQGRQNAIQGDVVRAVETYMDGSYDGNLYHLLFLFNPRWTEQIAYYPHIDNKALDGFLTPYFNSANYCDDDCDACGHCPSFAAASIDNDENRRLMTAAGEKLAQRREPFDVHRKKQAAKKPTARLARTVDSALVSIKRVGSRGDGEK